MAQRILEPGEIEALAQRSILRFRPPDANAVFAGRAARLRKLAESSGIADYLRFLAALCDAQQAALATISVHRPPPEHFQRCFEHGMPPIHPSAWPSESWRYILVDLCKAVIAHPDVPLSARELLHKVAHAPVPWCESQAAGLLLGKKVETDLAAAPVVMAALQVVWVGLAATVSDRSVPALDVTGICPLCGTAPVSGIVRANPPYQGYRYLHCALCASEWHMVRIQCSACGASGKSISYHTASSVTAPAEADNALREAVRAETCEECHGYRKMLYEECDIGVDAVADDLATLSLDLLLGERGYRRISGNPLLWQSGEDEMSANSS